MDKVDPVHDYFQKQMMCPVLINCTALFSYLCKEVVTYIYMHAKWGLQDKQVFNHLFPFYSVWKMCCIYNVGYLRIHLMM